MVPDLPIDVYARVSRRGDKHQRSTTSQVQVCKGILAERGLPAGVVHVDDGKSAWNPRVRRPGWDALMGRLESGLAGGVIVFDLERFTRQPELEGGRLIKAAERGLIVLDSDAEFDLTTASGKKAFRDAMAAAAYYSDRLSDRVTRGKRAKAMAGEPNGSTRPFGFEPDLVTVRASEAAELAAHTARFLAGESLEALIADWNQRDVLTTFGVEWDRTRLRRLLTRERNAGLIVYKGNVVGRLPGPPIISEPDLRLVQATFAARKRGRPPSPAYTCSGFAVCGVDGARLGGQPRPHLPAYEDGGVRREYRCRNKHDVGQIAVDQRALDREVRGLVVAILSDRRHAGQVERAAAARAGESAKLDQQIAQAEELRLALADRLGSGEIDLDAYDAANRPLTKRIKDLHAKRTALPATGGPAPAGTAEEWSRRWDDALPGERRAMIRLALRGRVIAVGPPDSKDRANTASRLTLIAPGG